MSKKERIKRYLLCVVSLYILSIGIAFSKTGGLGVSPITSVPNSLSICLPFMTIGNWTIVFYLLMVIAQFIMLKKEFKLFQLLQIPLSFVFGYFTDFSVWLISFIPPTNYALQFLYALLGIVIIAFGISASVCANVIMNPPEETVQVIAKVVKKDFGTVKIIFDVCCVLLTTSISFILAGHLVGIREGTVLTALLVGIFVKIWNKIIKEKTEAFLKK